jgi:hypothetical protein
MCFSIWSIVELIVWFMCIVAALKISKLIGPWLESISGIPWITQVLLILIYLAIAIRVIYLLAEIISCLLGGFGGVGLHHGGFYQQ